MQTQALKEPNESLRSETVKVESLYDWIGKFGWLYDLGLKLSGYTMSVNKFVQVLLQEAQSPLKTVLEAGCGTGQYALAVLRNLPEARVTAFDLQESMVNRARENFSRAGFSDRVYVFTGSVTGKLGEVDEQFDAIVIGGVLEYVLPEKAVANLTRFLRAGGYILHVPVRDTVWGKFIGKLYRFTPYSRERIIKAFTSQGFVLKKTYTVPYLPSASFKEAHIFQKI